MRHVVLLLIVLIEAHLAFAQLSPIRFRQISSEQGLSNSTIETIFQDSRGFIWFGTRDGLNRFDGNTIEVYRYNASNPKSISDNYIRCIFEDKQGFIWIGTSNGLNMLDTRTGFFTRFKNIPGDKTSLSNNLVASLIQDKTGLIWIGTANGLNLYQPLTRSFKSFLPDEDPEKRIAQVNCLTEDDKGHLWLGTEAGLYEFDRKSNKYIPASIIVSTSIRVITTDTVGNIWLGTAEDGLYRFRPSLRQLTHYVHDKKIASSMGTNLVRSLLIDNKGKLWVGGVNGGLNLFLPENTAFQHFQNEPSNPSSLSQRTVSAMFEDKQGNVWIGTHRGGINLYMPGRQIFGLQRQEAKPSSLSHNNVKCFFEDQEGMLWIGTDGGGLNRYDPNTGLYRHYNNDPFKTNTLGSDEVLHVMEDSRGNLWVSTWGGGLNLLDRKTGSFTRYMHNPLDSRSISSNFVQQVFEDDDKKLWVATYSGGLNLLEPQTKTFERVVSDENHLTHPMGNNFVSICQDAKGNLWFGTDDGGLSCYRKSTKDFANYFVRNEKMPDLRVLFVDSRQRLWVGQNGLYLFDAAADKFSLFTEQAGLGSEFIKGMAEDEAGYFWISTSNGITRIHPDTKKFKKYSTADGLQGPEFEANAYLKTRNGQLLFGGINGYNAFFPKDIKTNEFIPPVYLTALYVANKKVLPGDEGRILFNEISATKEITLKHSEASFSVEFAALNFIIPENNQYAYRLLGLSDTWNYVGNERKATYTNLDPGDYVFEIKAANNDGVWNNQPLRLSITVAPPFWQAWWFRILVALLVFSTVFIFLYLKRRYEIQKMEEAKREEIHQMQLQFFTNISHEFRTPLSLILGPLEKLQQEETDGRLQQYFATMHRNASRLLNLISELMDFRKAESGALKLRVMPGNLKIFLGEIGDVFKTLAEEKSIRFDIQSPEDLYPLWFDRQVLEKIMINLVGNSFKYTSTGGTIQVRASRNIHELPSSYQNDMVFKHGYEGKEYLYIQVADNGIGISKDSLQHLFERYYKISESHLGSGVGLAFVKSLTVLHKGDIYVHSERHRGTEITIALPVSADDYSAEEKWTTGAQNAVVNIESIHNGLSSFGAEERHIITPLTHKLILLVDDNDELRRFLKDSLINEYSICEAVNGREAIELVQEKMPDLIITDVMMPLVDGIELCRLIKSNDTTSHIPVLMLSAKAAIEAKLEGTASGADFYFSKPLNINLLKLTIRNIFQRVQSLSKHLTQSHQVQALANMHSTKDKAFMEQLTNLLEEHLSNPDLDVDFICKHQGMSRTKLYQTIKNITGSSITDFVRTVRLRKAAQIMTDEDVLITDVMYRVGMQTQSYFTKAFKKEFGKTPTQFLQDLEKL